MVTILREDEIGPPALGTPSSFHRRCSRCLIGKCAKQQKLKNTKHSIKSSAGSIGSYRKIGSTFFQKAKLIAKNYLILIQTLIIPKLKFYPQVTLTLT